MKLPYYINIKGVFYNIRFKKHLILHPDVLKKLLLLHTFKLSLG